MEGRVEKELKKNSKDVGLGGMVGKGGEGRIRMG